jgi:hypothetical protein
MEDKAMQTDFIIQFFTSYIQRETARLAKQLSETYDFRQFEDDMRDLMNQFEACITMCVLNECLTNGDFLMPLKKLAGKLGMKFKEYRPLHIRLQNGLEIKITTPYFIKAKPKRGRKKRGQMGGVGIWDRKFWVLWAKPRPLF